MKTISIMKKLTIEMLLTLKISLFGSNYSAWLGDTVISKPRICERHCHDIPVRNQYVSI